MSAAVATSPASIGLRGLKDRRPIRQPKDPRYWRDFKKVHEAFKSPIKYNQLLASFEGFVRLKAANYFLMGGDYLDLVQEGRIGLAEAIRDYDGQSSLRNFVEHCIVRQLITAVKTATRHKHGPLNNYEGLTQVAFAMGDGDITLAEVLPGPSVDDPVVQVSSSEELHSLLGCLMSDLSDLEQQVLSLYLDGLSYEEMAGRLGIGTKSVDNAIQRVRNKVSAHLRSRAVLDQVWPAA